VQRICDTEDHLSESAVSAGDAVVAERGSVLTVVRSGILKRRLPVAIADVRLAFNQDVKAITPDAKRLLVEFLAFVLRAAEPHIVAQGVKVGPTVHSIKSGFLENFEIPLPPLAEQRRIAAILNEQMKAVERARRAAEARLDSAGVLPATYLTSVFEGAQASRWPKKKLGKVLIQRREIVHPSDNPRGPATFVGLEHIEPNSGRRIGAVDLEMSALTGRKPRFRSGDIVYGYLRPYLNKVWLADFDGLCSVDQFAYQTRGDVADAEYTAWFMRSPVYLRRSAIVTTTGQLPRIGIDEIAAVDLPLPPMPQQREVVAQIRGWFKQFDRCRNAVDAQLGAVDKLPGSLLRRAFSGEL
jgi:hypothetical protein